MRKQIVHSDDYNFEEKMKELLLGRKVVKAEVIDDQVAELTLDNGVVVETVGNEGCGGCGNGWYYLEELNDCNNVITDVECVVEGDEYDDVYHIYVFAEDKKINLIQYGGGDNGYYGTGLDGEHNFSEKTIKVGTNGCGDYQDLVFLHEVCHAIIECYVSRKQDEEFVEQFSKGLYQVLTDNPELLGGGK